MRMKAYFFVGVALTVLIACAPSYHAYRRNLSLAAGHVEQGKRYMRNGRYRQAVSSFKKALEINPNLIAARQQMAIAHYNLGREYLEWQRYALAAEEFEIALELDPRLFAAEVELRKTSQRLELLTLTRE